MEISNSRLALAQYLKILKECLAHKHHFLTFYRRAKASERRVCEKRVAHALHKALLK